MAVEGKRSFWLSAKDEANMARDSPAKVHPNVQLGLLKMVVVEMLLVALIKFFLVTPCDKVVTAGVARMVTAATRGTGGWAQPRSAHSRCGVHAYRWAFRQRPHHQLRFVTV